MPGPSTGTAGRSASALEVPPAVLRYLKWRLVEDWLATFGGHTPEGYRQLLVSRYRGSMRAGQMIAYAASADDVLPFAVEDAAAWEESRRATAGAGA